jgi:hypothetical protein
MYGYVAIVNAYDDIIVCVHKRELVIERGALVDPVHVTCSFIVSLVHQRHILRTVSEIVRTAEEVPCVEEREAVVLLHKIIRHRSRKHA